MKNRQRGRNGGKPRPGGGGGQNRGFDGNSSGRMRGNAQQLMEKFLAMARDASSAGDRVLAENYFQHADHYYRVLNARFEQQQQSGQHNPHNNGQRPYQGGNDRGFEGDYQGQPEQGGYQQQPQHQNYQQPPQQHQPQPQPQQPQQHYQQPQQHQPQPQAHEGDIGLPPGILGMTPGAAQGQQSDQGGAEPAEAGAGGERTGGGGRHGRRRRGPRERAAAADASAE